MTYATPHAWAKDWRYGPLTLLSEQLAVVRQDGAGWRLVDIVDPHEPSIIRNPFPSKIAAAAEANRLVHEEQYR
jgi:hypothetical protein